MLACMHPALFYLPGERLSLTELCAARIDGHVIELGEGYMPADSVEGASARARGIAVLVPAGAAVMGPSAAWIHGAGDAPPLQHHLQRAGTRRLRMRTDPRVVFHDTALPAVHHVLIAGVVVSDAARTLLDLARMSPDDPACARWARALVAVRPDLVDAARALLTASGRFPGKVRAAALLVEFGARGQEDVTR